MPAPLRLRILFTLAAVAFAPGCTCVDPAANAFFACDQGACPSGFACCEGVCRAGGCEILPDGGADGSAGCDPGSCAGCCRTGTCFPGTDALACGVNGGACLTCGSATVCQVGACAPDTSKDGGTDAGSTGLDAGSPDAGSPDAGPGDGGVGDAGAVDAGGIDGGAAAFDAGTDAGAPPGQDAGSDAGSAFDAGPVCRSPGTACAPLDAGCCAGLACIAAGVCAATTGETCASPAPLALDGGAASVFGAFSGAGGNDISIPCAIVGDNRDLAYLISVPAPQSLSATAAYLGSPAGLRLALMPPACTSAIACLDDFSGTTSIFAPSVPTGTWMLVVDGSNGRSFRLDVALGGAMPVGCFPALPQPLPFSTSGSLSGASLGSTGVCGDVGPEQVFAVTTTAPGALVITGQSSAPGVTALYSLTDAGLGCAPATLIGCFDPRAPGDLALISPVLPPGQYGVAVDSVSDGGGTYSVSVTQRGAESCADAVGLPLSLDAGFIEVLGTTRGLVNNGTVGCLSSAGGDTAFLVTVPANAPALFSLVGSNGSRLAVSAQTLSTGCLVGGNLGCAAANLTASRNLGDFNATLLAGTSLITVDSDPASPGEFSLVVTVGNTPVPGELCGGAQANVVSVDVSAGPKRLRLTTNGAAADNIVCAGSTPSVYLKVTVPAGGGTLVAVARPLLDSFRPVLGFSATGCLSSQTLCATATAGGSPATLTTPVTGGAPVFLTVGGTSNQIAGPFTIDVRMQ